MSERLFHVGVPVETYEIYKQEKYLNPTIAKRIMHVDSQVMADGIAEEGLVALGDKFSVVFVPDRSLLEDSQPRHIWIYEGVRTDEGELKPGRFLSEVEMELDNSGNDSLLKYSGLKPMW